MRARNRLLRLRRAAELDDIPEGPNYVAALGSGPDRAPGHARDDVGEPEAEVPKRRLEVAAVFVEEGLPDELGVGRQRHRKVASHAPSLAKAPDQDPYIVPMIAASVAAVFHCTRRTSRIVPAV